MTAPVFPIDIRQLKPAELGNYMTNMYLTQTSLSLADQGIMDKGCWSVSRNISTLNIPRSCRKFLDRTSHGRLASRFDLIIDVY
jgi:hypothetical protein